MKSVSKLNILIDAIGVINIGCIGLYLFNDNNILEYLGRTGAVASSLIFLALALVKRQKS